MEKNVTGGREVLLQLLITLIYLTAINTFGLKKLIDVRCAVRGNVKAEGERDRDCVPNFVVRRCEGKTFKKVSQLNRTINHLYVLVIFISFPMFINFFHSKCGFQWS